MSLAPLVEDGGPRIITHVSRPCFMDGIAEAGQVGSEFNLSSSSRFEQSHPYAGFRQLLGRPSPGGTRTDHDGVKDFPSYSAYPANIKPFIYPGTLTAQHLKIREADFKSSHQLHGVARVSA